MSAKDITESGGGNLAATPGPAALAAYLAGLGKRSRASTLHALNRVAQIVDEPLDAIPWHEMRHHHVAKIRGDLADEYAPATANASLAALKGVLKSAWRLEQITSEDYLRAIDVRGVPGSRLPAGRALPADDVTKLLDACDGDGDKPTIAARDKGMIALLLGAGLRRAEAAAVQLEDYDGRAVTVIGKGGKERRASLLGNCAEMLDAWIALRGKEPGPLLQRVTQTGEILPGRIADKSISDRLTKLARQAQIDKVTPHDLRRTYITMLLSDGADLMTVQRLAGHASSATTARYDRRPDEEADAVTGRVKVGSRRYTRPREGG